MSSRAQLEKLDDRQLLIMIVQLLEEIVASMVVSPTPRPVPPGHHIP